MNVAIIIAMDIEYDNMVKVLGGTNQGDYAGNHIVLMKCGIGKVNAAVRAAELIKSQQPDCVLSTGLAGGIDPAVNVRDVVIGTQLAYHDVWCGVGNQYGQVQGLPPRFASHPRLVQVAMSMCQRSDLTHTMHQGLVCSGDKFITNTDLLYAIKRDFPDALAVDMESAAVAHTCYLYNVPFLAIRIISDTPGRTDNHQQQWEDFLHDMSNRSFLWMRQFLSILPNQL